MKIAMVVCLCFVSTGVSATEPQVCVNVSVTPDEGPSPQYPVANGSLTELVIHAPKKDFGSVAVFLGPECLLQLRQLGAPGGWTCLFALPLTMSLRRPRTLPPVLLEVPGSCPSQRCPSPCWSSSWFVLFAAGCRRLAEDGVTLIRRPHRLPVGPTLSPRPVERKM
nr:uncharacterized protein LOC113816639 isoform X1 [Penaeus vannamei]